MFLEHKSSIVRELDFQIPNFDEAGRTLKRRNDEIREQPCARCFDEDRELSSD